MAFDSKDTAAFKGVWVFCEQREGVIMSTSYQLLSEHFNARIQLLERDGKARTLATPTLLVANNEVSRLFIGQEVPITTGVTLEPVSSTTSSGVTYVTGYTVEPETSIRSVGTTLLVTPSINADRTVTLHLIQEESAVVPDGGSIPYGDAATLQSFSVDTVESRRVSGTFITADGLLAAVGGLIKETESETVSRIPILGRIPLIGFLFRSTEQIKKDNPDLPAYETYDALLSAIERVIGSEA